MSDNNPWPQMYNPFSGITKSACSVPNVQERPTPPDIIDGIANAMDNNTINRDNLRDKCDQILDSMPDADIMNTDHSQKVEKSELQKLIDNGYNIIDKSDDGHWSEVRRDNYDGGNLLLG